MSSNVTEFIKWIKDTTRKRLEPIDPLPKDASATQYAIHHSLADYWKDVAATGANEEHRTSALMAKLGSHLSWYRTIEQMADSNSSAEQFLWGPQSKVEETYSGGDFGIAVKIDEELYNLAFFQAKNSKVPPDSDYAYCFDVGQIPTSTKNSEPDLRNANINLKKWINSPEDSIQLNTLENLDKGRLFNTLNKNYQIFKLAVINQKGLELSANKTNPNPDPTRLDWAHYVIWPHDDIIPFTRQLRAVRNDFLNTQKEQRRLENTTSYVTKDEAKSQKFSTLLTSGLLKDAAGWLSITRNDAEKLIGPMIEIGCPWFVLNDSSSGGLLDEMKLLSPVKDLTSTQQKDLRHSTKMTKGHKY